MGEERGKVLQWPSGFLSFLNGMMIAGEVNGILLKSKAKWNADKWSGQCERYDVIATFGWQPSVSARRDHNELFAAGLISHRRRLPTRRQFSAPQLFAGFDIE